MATTNTTTMDKVTDSNNKGIRSFKSSNDIESFYRFVYENGLRREAAFMLNKVCDALTATKSKKKTKKGRKKKIQ